MNNSLPSSENLPDELRVEQCDGYELHYRVDGIKRQPTNGPVVVYFPVERKTYTQNFSLVPGLTDRDSPRFDPKARQFGAASVDRFVISSQGILSGSPYLRGLVEHLRQTGGFEHVFQICDLPEIRWDNLPLQRCEVPEGLAQYCGKLRELFANGFVDCCAYTIGEGELADAIMIQKGRGSPMSRAMFVELFRHPMVREDFNLTEVYEPTLLDLNLWPVYSPFLVAGLFAATLAHGGAYRSLRNDTPTALSMAQRAFEGLNRDYWNFEFSQCGHSWNDRFFDVAWDLTWVILDRERRRLIVCVASDTD